MDYYNKNTEEVFHELGTNIHGLHSKEAENRLHKFGPNAIKHEKKISKIKIFISQFKSFIIYILIFAFLVSLVIGIVENSKEEFIDAGVIFAILILNALIGFFQEYRAEKSIEALRKLASLKARVMRDGKEHEIDAKDVVPGDILVLTEGDKIPADARLIKAINLETHEASLTGESTPVQKQTAPLENKPIAEQNNMVFASTIITRGKGLAIATGTGMSTEIGKIAKLIQETKTLMTPLQIKLKQLGKVLSYAILGISLIVFLTGILTGNALMVMFLAAISLAVAAVPEGLPAVVTISLSLGVKRLVKKNALIRKLPSVETLGSTTVICSDKTGTLTHNEMTVKRLYTNNKVIDITGSGYEPKGEFTYNNSPADPKDYDLLLRIGLLCNDAIIDEGKVIGDPTEAALIVSAEKSGYAQEAVNKEFTRIDEIPFESSRKLMSTIHDDEGRRLMLTKGAPDMLLQRCSKIFLNGKEQPLSDELKKRILKQNESFASQALRVLGFAYRYQQNKEDKHEENLVFAGLQAMMDPPRTEVKESIQKCKDAGIKVVMITGDHMTTAIAVARELGIEGKAMTGQELAKIKNLEDHVMDIGIYARVNPEHKQKIVKALQALGHVVAMTGDGVNDAPALKKANIGIAMGISGTDVSKEASAMILTDDNFASIVNAVEEGRGIYNNIKKFINYLLSSNLAEVLVIFIAIIIGWPLPLVAVQILWMNLVTDGLPAVALGMDPVGKGVMKNKPRNPKESIVNKNMMLTILSVSSLITIATLLLFYLHLPDVDTARTVAFTALVFFELVRVYVVRFQYKTKMLSNGYLFLAILLSLALQVIVIYTPMSLFFATVPLGFMEWVYIAGASAALFGCSMILNKIIKKVTKED